MREVEAAEVGLDPATVAKGASSSPLGRYRNAPKYHVDTPSISSPTATTRPSAWTATSSAPLGR